MFILSCLAMAHSASNLSLNASCASGECDIMKRGIKSKVERQSPWKGEANNLKRFSTVDRVCPSGTPGPRTRFRYQTSRVRGS